MDHHPEWQNNGQVETQIPEWFKEIEVPVGGNEIAGEMESHSQKRRQSCFSIPCQRRHQASYGKKRQKIMEEEVMICSEGVDAEDD